MLRVDRMEETASELYAEIYEDFTQEIDGLTEKIEKHINDQNARFFKQIVMKGLNKPNEPRLGEDTPTWKPLNPRYVKYKKKGNANFYLYKGELTTALQTLANSKTQATERLGGAYASLQKGGLVGNPDVAFTSFMRGGRRINQARMVDGPRKGQFARPEDIWRRVPTTIRVIPFRDQVIGAEEEMFNEFPEIYHRLRNWRGRRERPLIGPFMDWWIRTKLISGVEQLLKGVFK